MNQEDIKLNSFYKVKESSLLHKDLSGRIVFTYGVAEGLEIVYVTNKHLKQFSFSYLFIEREATKEEYDAQNHEKLPRQSFVYGERVTLKSDRNDCFTFVTDKGEFAVVFNWSINQEINVDYDDVERRFQDNELTKSYDDYGNNSKT